VGRTSVEATSPDEVEHLLKHSKNGLRIAIALAALAGLRSGEVRALTRGDIDLNQTPALITVSKSTATGIVTRTKSGHDRQVPVSARLLAILEPHLKGLKPSSLVSLNSAKKEWGDVGLSVAYSRVAKRLGIKSSKYHALRHHFATQLFVKCNAPATTVQHLLGHENLSVTQRYAHHDRKKAEEAVALL
jgi:integrase